MSNNVIEELIVSDHLQWRKWLSDNHDKLDEIWLVYYKKHTGKASISYVESVEEAICFGWIDGKKRSIDEQKYAHRFSPRRAKSKWTPLNIKRAKALIEQGRMSKSGLRSFEQRVEYDERFLELRSQQETTLPESIENTLRANKKAWANFNALAPGYKKQYILWLVSAKKPETRARRLQEALLLLAENKKLGMK